MKLAKIGLVVALLGLVTSGCLAAEQFSKMATPKALFDGGIYFHSNFNASYHFTTHYVSDWWEQYIGAISAKGVKSWELYVYLDVTGGTSAGQNAVARAFALFVAGKGWMDFPGDASQFKIANLASFGQGVQHTVRYGFYFPDLTGTPSAFNTWYTLKLKFFLWG